jgi:hypothetical protein
MNGNPAKIFVPFWNTALNLLRSNMYWTLAHQEWLRIRRSADFHKNVGVKIFWGILIGFLMLEILGIGLFAGVILKEKFPQRNPVTIFNSILLFYFLSDLLMRIMGQKLQTLAAKPYLTLPIPRTTIVRYILARTLMTLFNVIPLLLFIPVSVNVVGAEGGAWAAIRWLVLLVSVMWMNCFIAATVKTKMLSYPRLSGIFMAVVFLIVGLGASGVIRLAETSSALFDSVVYWPPWLAVPMGLFAVVAYGAFHSFSRILQFDSVSQSSPQGLLRGEGRMFQQWGEIGRLIQLDLRMLFRNRRARPAVLVSLLMVFYGLFFFQEGELKHQSLFLLLIGFFLTGTLSVTYGSYTFSWESASFGVYTTRPLSWERLLWAKYVLMSIMTLLTFLMTGFYALFGWTIIFHNVVAVLFNIGVIAPLMLWLGTFARLRFDLDANAFSAQGKTVAHFGSVFVVLILMAVVYVAGWAVGGSNAGVALVGIMGLAGIFLRKRTIRMISAMAEKKKYAMIAGFRQR